MTPPPSVLVLGAGELGSEVLKSLMSHPACADTNITLLLRPSCIETEEPSKRAANEHYKSLGTSLLAGDVVHDSDSRLATLFSPFYTVISCTGMTCPSSTQLKITRAVLDAGVRRFFPWQFGIDYDSIGRNSAQDLFDEQLDVRDLLRSQSKTSWTIVSTGMFISFLFEPSFGLVDLGKGIVSAIGSWDNRLTVTSPQDIGKIVAELALVDVDETGVVFVAGDTVSMHHLVNIVGFVIGKTPESNLRTVDWLKSALEANPEDVMRKYRAVFGAGIGVAWDKSSTYNVRKGIETTSVQQWVEQNLCIEPSV